MKPIKINDDVLLIDDFLSPDELEITKKEIRFHKDDIISDLNIMEKTEYKRMFVDDIYENRRNDSHILKASGKIFTDEVYDIIKKVDMFSYPFKSISQSNHHETQLTSYGNGGKYKIHVDNAYGRTMSYVLPIDVNKKKWKEGQLVLIYKGEEIVVEPKNNQMILFSSHLQHKVNPVKINSKNVLDGRVVINGHLGFLV